MRPVIDRYNHKEKEETWNSSQILDTNVTCTDKCQMDYILTAISRNIMRN